MEIALASKTIVDWKELSRVLTPDVLDKGDQTLRSYMKVLEAMDLDSKQHVFYSFYFIMPDSFVLRVLSRTKLKLSIGEQDQRTSYGIMSGNIEEYEGALAVFCQESYEKVFRAFFNTIFVMLERDGVKFEGSRNELRDGTFTWKS